MKVELLDRTMVDSDLGVVNAARCSFDKESTLHHNEPYDEFDSICERENGECIEKEHWFLGKQDAKLIKYLALHQHWTPFAHAQLVFTIPEIAHDDLLAFLFHANLSGFEWTGALSYTTASTTVDIRGSLYAWLTNLDWLPYEIKNAIAQHIRYSYPVSYNALLYNKDIPGGFGWTAIPLSNSRHLELISHTLRIHCPIFVKRQLETHRRNLVMTDIEDFSQNEVSRRYVDTMPEFYMPREWRIQSKQKKQGSAGVFDLSTTLLCDMDYQHVRDMCKGYYDFFNSRGVAHEQSRMLLPLSTYTTFWWTGSMKSWQHMLKLRLQPDVQDETRELAQMIQIALQDATTAQSLQSHRVPTDDSVA